jgi:SAM-dependent methyltransferase
MACRLRFVPSEPADFHRGLASMAWRSIEGGPEIPYFRDIIDSSGAPILDAGCGAGRLLLPYLRDGLDIDGCDPSPDMLAICREKAEDLSPVLYEQPMHALDLARRYRTIVVCGAFGLGTELSQDQEALRRIHDHLLPGGTLAIDFETPWTDADSWTAWTPAKRRELPLPWGSSETILADGAALKTSTVMEAVDPFDRLVTRRVRFELWRDGQMEREEVHTLRERWHFPTELRLMLETAGFVDIELEGGYEHRPPTADDAFVVFTAERAGGSADSI